MRSVRSCALDLALTGFEEEDSDVDLTSRMEVVEGQGRGRHFYMEAGSGEPRGGGRRRKGMLQQRENSGSWRQRHSWLWAPGVVSGFGWQAWKRLGKLGRRQQAALSL